MSPSSTESAQGDKNTFGDTVSKLNIGHTAGIEKAYQREGADENHTPGYANRRGDEESANVKNAPGLGAAQGKSQEPSALGRMVDHMLNGKTAE